MADMLTRFELTDEAYERYSKQIDSQTGTKIIALKEQIHSKQGALTHIKKELKERGLAITSYDPASPIYAANDDRISELAQQQAELETAITDLSRKIVDPNQIKVGKEEFLNTVKMAPDKIRAGSAVEKDRVCRILFLNLRVDNEKVASYLWRESFASMVKATEFSFGAP
jgi:predicted  nucleic acid-binding Zn-ribbon protein